MIQEFKDQEPGDQHEAFERWKEAHPTGFILNQRSQQQAILHRSPCIHLRGPHQRPEKGQSLTHTLKLCSDDRVELTTEAARGSWTVENCESCRP